jgi:hypothetical protein
MTARDDEAAALRPTLLLALVVSVVVALVVFWPHPQPKDIPKSSAATPDPVAANTTALAATSAPPIEEITDEVIVMVPAPPLSTAQARPIAPVPSAMPSALASDAPIASNAPLALPVAPILSVAPIDRPRNTEQDKSEPARVTTKVWDCPWPPRGSQSKITQIKVHVKVSVTWDGRATEVEVLDDPGLDFGEYAKKCALTQVYVPARDAKGQPASGVTGSFAVLFDRTAR